MSRRPERFRPCRDDPSLFPEGDDPSLFPEAWTRRASDSPGSASVMREPQAPALDRKYQLAAVLFAQEIIRISVCCVTQYFDGRDSYSHSPFGS